MIVSAASSQQTWSWWRTLAGLWLNGAFNTSLVTSCRVAYRSQCVYIQLCSRATLGRRRKKERPHRAFNEVEKHGWWRRSCCWNSCDIAGSCRCLATACVARRPSPHLSTTTVCWPSTSTRPRSTWRRWATGRSIVGSTRPFSWPIWPPIL